MSEWSYEGKKIAPGRYSGSVWSNDIVICGNNYSLHFGSIPCAEAGDTILFTDVKRNVSHYMISETEILQHADREERTIGDGRDPTLFYLYPGRAEEKGDPVRTDSRRKISIKKAHQEIKLP